jgi:hypothetical protein
MPIDNTPLEEREATLRRNLGFNRLLEQSRTVPPAHPRNGGSSGYPVWYRQQQIDLYDAGQPIDVSEKSILRWKERIDPYRQTGNKECDVLRGQHQVLLSSYSFAYPEATADELATFIANSSDGTIYSRQRISDRLKELNMTRKRGSTEANQASIPRNKLIRELFWSRGPPTGIARIPRGRLIDIDECGLSLESANRAYGFAYSGVRVLKPGNYGRGVNVTVMLGIEPGHPILPDDVHGSLRRPRRWLRVSLQGANTLSFTDFVSSIVQDIDNHPLPGVEEDSRVFMWDNLNVHKSPLVYQAVEGGGRHLIVARPPYMPCDGPIEYIFCRLEAALCKHIAQVASIDNLMDTVRHIVPQLSGFEQTFRHCGYRWE